MFEFIKKLFGYPTDAEVAAAKAASAAAEAVPYKIEMPAAKPVEPKVKKTRKSKVDMPATKTVKRRKKV